MTHVSAHGRAHHSAQLAQGRTFHVNPMRHGATVRNGHHSAYTEGCTCSECRGTAAAQANARGDDNDPAQIRSDLISDDRSPFTAQHDEALRSMDAKLLRQLRDHYLGRRDNAVIHVNADDPEVRAMTAHRNIQAAAVAEQQGVSEVAPISIRSHSSTLPPFLQPTREDIAHWGSELEAATQLTLMWRQGTHPNKLRANRGAPREELEAMTLTRADVIRERAAKAAPLVRVAKE